MQHTFTAISSNAKTGPIAVTTTSDDTCGDHCAFRGNGCYAEAGPLGMLWKKLSATPAGETFKNGRADIKALSFDELLEKVESIPDEELWRHNQAGDLPGKGPIIDSVALARLAKANRGKRGFTYTHKPALGRNLDAIRAANAAGFTVNVSADSPKQAAAMKRLHPDLPLVCVLPIEAETSRYVEHDGARITVCPATRKNADGSDAVPGMTCAKCGLCQVRDRNAIVGFPAHGTSKRKANAIAAA